MGDSKYLRELAERLRAMASKTRNPELAALLARKAQDNIDQADALDAKAPVALRPHRTSKRNARAAMVR
jgi:hypothetical protein